MTWVDRYKHRKGGVYDVIAQAKVQTSVPLLDMDDVVVYQSIVDNSFWVRSPMEFNDGRFTAVARVKTGDPIGYDVIMEMTRMVVKAVKENDLEKAKSLNETMREIERLFPEATQLIENRWGKRE